MTKKELLNTVLSSSELPTLPGVASKLVVMTSDADVALADIADLVSQDIALSSKILMVSNSAFYGFPQQISSIQQAVSLLGTNAVRSLVLSFSFLSIRKGSKDNYFDFEKFWQHSLTSAVAAKLILESVPGADTNEILIVALLQNLGELIYARTLPDKYNEVLVAAAKKQQEKIAAERSIFGEDHCFIGYEVAKHWGFPPTLLFPILYHHNPEGYTGDDPNIRLTTKAIYLADLLVNVLYSDAPCEYHERFKREAKKMLKLSAKDIDALLAAVHDQAEQAGKYFGLDFKQIKPVQEILQEANIRLSLLNLDYEQMNQKLIESQISLEKLTKELQGKNELLDLLANTDGLTEVYNNRYFQKALGQEMNRAERNESHLALLLVDIDHFKKFNDSYGHQTGDFVLKEFCNVVASNLRQYDTLARYGGEEFIIILPGTTEEEAYTVAEKLRSRIEGHSFNDTGVDHQVTASFGVYGAQPANDDTVSKVDFIGRADKALYEAKKQGRNRVVLYGSKKKWYKRN